MINRLLMRWTKALLDIAERIHPIETMNITEHFTIEEFACHDGTPYPKQWIESRLKPLCEQLEVIRAELGEALHINSGYRTPAWNKKQGGAKMSQHIEGRAADIHCKNKGAREIYKTVSSLMDEGRILKGGIGMYNNFVHYDIRGSKVVWSGTRKRGVV